MKPIFQTGIFITLGLLLARRAEAKMENEFCDPFTLDCRTLWCCQDNTWDIGVTENSQPSEQQSSFTLVDLPEAETGIDFQTLGIQLNQKEPDKPGRWQPPLRNKAYHHDYSLTLFHPPSNVLA